MESIKEFIFKKLIFPKVFVIDKPGLIYSRNFSFINRNAHKIRVVYTFEDQYIKLYFDTIKKIGIKKTNALWYKVGKEGSTRYFLFNNQHNFSKSKIPKTIEHFQKVFSGVGMSACQNVKYDLDKKLFIFSGSNNVICRKTGNSSLIEGILSGVLSFILKENIEAKSFCGVSANDCKIVLRPEFDKKYIPDFNSLKISKNYILNFVGVKKVQSTLNSFSDFLKFNLVTLDNEKKFSFMGKTMVPSEIALPEIFAKRYLEEGYEKIFFDSLIKSTMKIAKEFCLNLNKLEDKIKFFRNLMSAFGFGEIYLRKDRNTIKVEFLNPIFMNFDLNFIKCVINGFLNYLYEKSFIFEKGDNKIFWYILK